MPPMIYVLRCSEQRSWPHILKYLLALISHEQIKADHKGGVQLWFCGISVHNIRFKHQSEGFQGASKPEPG